MSPVGGEVFIDARSRERDFRKTLAKFEVTRDVVAWCIQRDGLEVVFTFDDGSRLECFATSLMLNDPNLPVAAPNPCPVRRCTEPAGWRAYGSRKLWCQLHAEAETKKNHKRFAEREARKQRRRRR